MALALYSSTTLPLVIALTELGVATGRMHQTNATALVAAGMISVLLFPMVAMALHGKPRPVAVLVPREDVVQAS
jgi:hypothetical protein